MPEWIIRDARPEDEQSLAELSIIAGHGFIETLYQDLFPGRTLEEVIIERRLRNPRSIGYLGYWRVAAGLGGDALGAVNAVPPAALDTIEGDAAVPPDRKRIMAPFRDLDPHTDNTYHINMLAVFPQHRHAGVARALVADAAAAARAASQTILTLLTYEEDDRLVQYYRRLGFAVTAARPVIPHPLFRHRGNVVAMAMPVSA